MAGTATTIEGGRGSSKAFHWGSLQEWDVFRTFRSFRAPLGSGDGHMRNCGGREIADQKKSTDMLKDLEMDE
jgi:hypothetical protein